MNGTTDRPGEGGSAAHVWPWAVIGFTLIADQLSKYWILEVFRLPEKRSVEVLPFFDLTMVWNKGISLGLFQQDSVWGRWILIGFTMAVTSGLIIWLIRARRALLSLGLALVIGGAVGNAIDRIRFGAVADFLEFSWGSYSYYVFNIADTAITIGVGCLLLDHLLESRKTAVEDQA
ncbi:MAG: signal peptidase II [Pseudomonadota bacterium]